MMLIPTRLGSAVAHPPRRTIIHANRAQYRGLKPGDMATSTIGYVIHISLKHLQQKCAAVLRRTMRQTTQIERFCDSEKSGIALFALYIPKEAMLENFQQNCGTCGRGA